MFVRRSVLVATLLLTLLGALATRRAIAAGDAIVPVHGVVVAPLGTDAVVVRTDAVPQMLSAGTRTFRVATTAGLAPGVEIDAFARGNRLDAVHPAERFAAGLPNGIVTHILGVGDRLPGYTYLDQRDRPVRFADFLGKTVLLSFTFTRCPDARICPAITAKFAYLQAHLDRAKYHLVLVTLDPPFDSPPILGAYAANYQANAASWSFFTGTGSDVKTTQDMFGISSIEERPGKYLHEDRLAIIDPTGRIAQILPTAGWEPDDVIAVLRNMNGEASNPWRRLVFASLAGLVALCGGSDSTAIVVLDSTVFILGVGILGSVLVYWGRRIFARDA